MRGRLTDFTVLEPVAPVAVRALPRDFDQRGHDDFLNAPRAAELVECDRCDWRLCNRLIRAEGRTVKPDCAAFLVMDGPTAPPAPSVIERAMSILRAEGPQTLQDLAARLGVKYFTLRHHVDLLLAAGCIVCVGLRANGCGRAKVYAATDAPLPTPKPVTNPAMKRVMNANHERILDLLRARGPLAVRDIAAATGLHATTVLERLKALEAAGQARKGEIEQRSSAARPRYKAQLWEATHD